MSRISFLIVVGGEGWENRSAPHQCPVLIHCDDWLRVYSSEPAAAWALPDRDGILLGRIFNRSGPPAPGLSTSSMPLRDVDVQSSCWGDYVIVRGGSAARASIYRSPGATTPCYYRVEDGCTAIASDVRLLDDVFGKRPAVCWDGVAFQLSANGFPSRKTALAGVLEVERGTRLIITRLGPRVERLWDPWAFVCSEGGVGTVDEVERLRDVIVECVKALGTTSRAPFLSLSGGLDSSIVAAACSASDIRPHCFTMVDRTPSGDEKRFAEAVSERFGFDLAPLPYEMGMVDVTRPSFPHMPRPIGRILGQTLVAARRRLAPGCDAATLLTGIGGDNVFCFLQSATPVADAIAERRWRSTWTGLGDVSKMSGASLFSVGVAALKRLSRPARYPWRPNWLFLNNDWSTENPIRLDHPWLDAPDGSRPGSAAHIANLMRLQTTIVEPAPESGWDQLNPLLAQPVVEFCLGIPSWKWCAGGRDRAVARNAFSSDLPSVIIERRHKGGPEGFCIAILDQHRELLRNRLVGGHLAARGLLDMPAIEGALAKDRRFKSSEYLRLLELADAEAWVEHWQS